MSVLRQLTGMDNAAKRSRQTLTLTLFRQGRQGLTSDQVSLAELRQGTERKVGMRLTLNNRGFW